tara:strand:+ start:5220 stop:6656 length:1437 start_codon:yes stop_codon:yes gene_type:complete
MKFFKSFIIYLLLVFSVTAKHSNADFFKDITSMIDNNDFRLSYGVSVTDINQDNKYEFVVTGFGFSNLALSYKNGKLVNINKSQVFDDSKRKTIGVAACDIDQDGFEEIYFLNTDTYSGEKKYSDRLVDKNENNFLDLFEKDINKKNLNLTAGRSVVCVDRNGDGKYGIYVANYGGPTRFYELSSGQILDIAETLRINKITGGRAVVAGNILSGKTDIFAANERGKNYLYYNANGYFQDIAEDYAVDDQYENGRGTTLTDILYRGRLDIVTSNWNGYHRAFVLEDSKFKDIATPTYNIPTRIRTIISADFDNDGYDEIFMNNIGEPNKLFKIRDDGFFEEIMIQNAFEANGLGTGAAVADIDNDGILELLVSHGESGLQPLTMYKADLKKGFNYLRIKPINKFGAPARGATVILSSNLRKHAKTIDAGSGYLCQMEPVAHYGIRDGEKNISIDVIWTNGISEKFNINELNKTIEIRQK